MDTTLHVKIETVSPISLSSGQADVTVDTDVIHDEYGLPYFPAKRLRGLLYESAIEVVEMSELCGNDFVTRDTVNELFGRVDGSAAKMNIHDFHLENYDDMIEDLKCVEQVYKECVQPSDVLAGYTSLRYQTSIDEKTGVAADTSLHNMRVVNAGIVFFGEIRLCDVETAHVDAVVWALQNLRYAGLKRNRGFGKIQCMVKEKNITERLGIVSDAEVPSSAQISVQSLEKISVQSSGKESQKDKVDKYKNKLKRKSTNKGQKRGKRK
jgi:CRISPR-associated protein Csx10